jgi:hypothetical protein
VKKTTGNLGWRYDSGFPGGVMFDDVNSTSNSIYISPMTSNSGHTFKEKVINEWKKENALVFKSKPDALEYKTNVSARISPAVSMSFSPESFLEKSEDEIKNKLIDHLYHHIYKHHRKVVDEITEIMKEELYWKSPESCEKILKLLRD